MKTYKVGLIRVLTTEDEELLQLHPEAGLLSSAQNLPWS